MTVINEDIFEIANQACLKIEANDKFVGIKHSFRLGFKSTLGVIFFLFGGLFLIIAPFIKTSDITTKFIGIIFGLTLVVFATLTLIKQLVDGIFVNNQIFRFRHNLIPTTIPLNSNLKIKMNTEVIKIRRVGSLGSDFIIVTLLLVDNNKDIPILKFQMDNSDAYNAKKLGNELIRIINDKLR